MSIKVSVFTTTYNHEQFIAQAVESVMAQQAGFAYEHVIGEDRSTDATRAILVGLQQVYPGRIRLLLRDQNIGRRANFIDTFRACRGEYVAILEGDDYWTAPHKLRSQADYLDQHPECVLCFHPVLKRFEEEGREKVFAPPEPRATFALDDLLERNFIATCSVMFRNGLFGEFPDWFWTVPAGDLPLHVLNAQHGDIGYLDQVMAVHRIHRGGVWSPKHAAVRLQAKIEVLEALRGHLGCEHRDRLDQAMARLHIRKVRALGRKGDYRAAVSCMSSVFLHARVPRRVLLQSLVSELGRKARESADE